MMEYIFYTYIFCLYYTARMFASVSAPVIHDAIKPLAWLIGKWKAENAKGFYPTMKDFTYIEELEFFHVGQPNIQFNWYAYQPETGVPQHRHVGFIRVDPETNNVAINAAHHFGLAEVEEGHMTETELCLTSQIVGNVSFVNLPKTKKIRRIFIKIDGDTLKQVVDMETSNTPMTQHLTVTYKRIN